MKQILSITALMAWGLTLPLAEAQVKKSDVPGVTNFAQVETTVACAGAVTPASVAGIKKMGFASIINLRQADEKGADIDSEAAAAKDAGIAFVHIPMNGAKPDPAVADKFMQTITSPGTSPAFIHCASGNRAAAMWMIKRGLVDKWEIDRAAEEAAQLGLTSEALKKYATDYINSHKK
ncbi:MAG: sulfur transferase domain-containing protein [Bryobacteraceae bacterium]